MGVERVWQATTCLWSTTASLVVISEPTYRIVLRRRLHAFRSFTPQPHPHTHPTHTFYICNPHPHPQSQCPLQTPSNPDARIHIYLHRNNRRSIFRPLDFPINLLFKRALQFGFPLLFGFFGQFARVFFFFIFSFSLSFSFSFWGGF